MIDYEYIKKNTSDELVFFLHGWGGNKDSFLWVKDYIDANLVFVSFSGFGNNPPPKKPLTLFDYAQELQDLIVYLAKGKKVSIVCHSFGCRVIAKLYSIWPTLVKKIMIIDGAGVKPKRGLKYYYRVWKYKRLKKKVKKGHIDKNVLDNFGSNDYKSLSKIMKQTFINVVNADLKNAFKNIRVPVVLFWGNQDKETPIYMAKKLNKWIKGSELVLVNGGHFSYLDDTNTFLEVLKCFINI